jgi:Lrp/AsnC family transcriptional regulator of ectoine degradation
MTRLDAIDFKILTALQARGRITKVALAAAVNLTPTPSWQRHKRLENPGIVKAYRAEIDLDRLGHNTTVLVENVLKQHRYEDIHRFEAAIRAIDEVVDCYATGGGIDYLLKIVTRDVDAYQRLIDQLLLAQIGIDRYFTYIVTRAVKSCAQPPVELLMRLGAVDSR